MLAANNATLVDFDQVLAIEESTFIGWANVHLQSSALQLTNLTSDLADGVVLVALAEALSGKRIRDAIMEPHSAEQEIANIELALQHLAGRERVQLVPITADDIRGGDSDLVLGLLWSLIVHYDIHHHHLRTAEEQAAEKRTAQDVLLEWVDSKLPQLELVNFTEDWRDGLALFGLVRKYNKSALPAVPPQSALETATAAMQAATKHLGVPALISPQDFVLDECDHLATMAYLAMFRNAVCSEADLLGHPVSAADLKRASASSRRSSGAAPNARRTSAASTSSRRQSAQRPALEPLFEAAPGPRRSDPFGSSNFDMNEFMEDDVAAIDRMANGVMPEATTARPAAATAAAQQERHARVFSASAGRPSKASAGRRARFEAQAADDEDFDYLDEVRAYEDEFPSHAHTHHYRRSHRSSGVDSPPRQVIYADRPSGGGTRMVTRVHRSHHYHHGGHAQAQEGYERRRSAYGDGYMPVPMPPPQQPRRSRGSMPPRRFADEAGADYMQQSQLFRQNYISQRATGLSSGSSGMGMGGGGSSMMMMSGAGLGGNQYEIELAGWEGGRFFAPACFGGRSFPVNIRPSHTSARLGAQGPAWLQIHPTHVALLERDSQRTIFSCPLNHIARFGMDVNVMSLEVGALNPRAAGVYFLETPKAKEAFAMLDMQSKRW